MPIYLSSFYPLACTKNGKLAAKLHQLPPFIDGSCRREPDFQNDYPAITGLCRPGFAKKLSVNDIVIYATNKFGIGSRKIVAALKVINTNFKSHEEAAAWYKENGCSIPNNLMVKETSPFELDLTHQLSSWIKWANAADTLEKWNGEYELRANAHPEVAICEKIFSELENPAELTEEEMERIFKRRPGTRNPSTITEQQWAELKKIIGLK
jgi:hypothetical protein